jgi:lysine-N-methylase
MKIRVPSYFNEFKCIASACEDTCCVGWDVVIDAQTFRRYLNMEGAFGEKLRSLMVVDQDGDNIFVLDGDRCPFLNNNDLCDIYLEKGEQNLCYTCKQYPRYIEEFFDLREIGISLSCPEAARIILGHEKQTEFEFSEDSQEGDKAHGEDEEILEKFFQCRATIINILEMVDIPLGVKAAIVLKFAHELQDKITFGELDAITKIREKYNKSSFLFELSKELYTYKGNEVDKYNDVYEYFKTYRNLEHIGGNDPLELNKVLGTYLKSEEDRDFYIEQHREFNHYYKEEMGNFNKILVYYIYRYFMKSFYDYDMSSKIKVALMSTIMIKELAVVRWIENGEFSEADMVDISHRYSKDIEHLEKNVEVLERIFESKEVYAVDKIINTLVNEF